MGTFFRVGRQYSRVSQSEYGDKDELVERALNKLAQGGDTEQVLIELANRLTNKLIHAPTQALTAASRQGDLNTLGQLRTALGLDKN